MLFYFRYSHNALRLFTIDKNDPLNRTFSLTTCLADYFPPVTIVHYLSFNSVVVISFIFPEIAMMLTDEQRKAAEVTENGHNLLVLGQVTIYHVYTERTQLNISIHKFLPNGQKENIPYLFTFTGMPLAGEVVVNPFFYKKSVPLCVYNKQLVSYTKKWDGFFDLIIKNPYNFLFIPKIATSRPVARGGSRGSDDPPTPTKSHEFRS